MRIIIAGSRTLTEQDVRKALHNCSWIGFATAVVSGTARGADEYGEKWAKINNVEIARFPADWTKHGKRAGPLRNKTMAENAEGLIAVWDGNSRGTLNMIDVATSNGLRVAIFRTDTNTIEERPPAGQLAAVWEFVEERAAMKEFDTGLPRRQAEREAGAMAVQFIKENSNGQ